MFADQMDVAEQDSVSNATESRRKRVDYMEIEDTHRYLEDTLQREHEERINSKRRSVDSDVSEVCFQDIRGQLSSTWQKDHF